jgi:preprotein translocase subunit SecG
LTIAVNLRSKLTWCYSNDKSWSVASGFGNFVASFIALFSVAFCFRLLCVSVFSMNIQRPIDQKAISNCSVENNTIHDKNSLDADFSSSGLKR